MRSIGPFRSECTLYPSPTQSDDGVGCNHRALRLTRQPAGAPDEEKRAALSTPGFPSAWS